MLITPRLCLERNWHAAFLCEPCRVLRGVWGFPRTPAKLMDVPVATLFEAGCFRCGRCKAASTLMILEEQAGPKCTEIARWAATGPRTQP